MGWLQPFWRDLFVDHRRTAAALQWLAQDPRVEKVFIEPHLRQTLGASHPKVRFQGCRAARHDDHIHFQI
jgi:murein endopeptidase